MFISPKCAVGDERLDRCMEGLSIAPPVSPVWSGVLFTRSGVLLGPVPYTNLSKSDFQFYHLTEAERLTARVERGCLWVESEEKSRALKL